MHLFETFDVLFSPRRLWNMLLVSLLCGSHSAVRGWIRYFFPSSLLCSSPLRQHTSIAQLTLTQQVSPQTDLGGQPIFSLCSSDWQMLRSWTKAIPFISFRVGKKLVPLLLVQGQIIEHLSWKWAVSILSRFQCQAFTLCQFFIFSWLVIQLENVSAVYQCLSLVPAHPLPHRWCPVPPTVCQPVWDTISTSPI